MRARILKMQTAFAVFLIAIQICAGTADAQKWGSLKGRFIVEGSPAPPPPLTINNRPLFLQKDPPNETVVIGKGGALANVVVYLRVPRGYKIEVAPAYADKLKVPAELGIKD